MKHLARIALTLAASAFAFGASAQTYPSGPITIVNPYPAGGPAGLMAQVIADRISPILGQPVVVESRPGGGATIAGTYVAGARPDGHTLLIAGAPTYSISPAMIGNVPYDGVTSFTQIATVTNVGNAIAVNSASPIQSVEQLIEAAKANPGSITYGSPGVGSLGHIAGESIKQTTGVNMTHVPYQGAAPAIADLLANNISSAILNVTPFVTHSQAGTVRVLATTGPNRSLQLPDVPTMDELGFAGFDVQTWYSIAGPAGLPQAVIDKVYAALEEALKDEAVVKRLNDAGIEVFLQDPATSAAYVKADTEKMIEVIKAGGIKAE